MMQTFVRPSRDLRNHYSEIADMTKNHNHVIITNQGRGESVLINIEDYAKYEEFLHQPAGAGWAGHRLCRPHWASHRQPSALGGTCKRKQSRRNELFRNVNCKEKHR